MVSSWKVLECKDISVLLYVVGGSILEQIICQFHIMSCLVLCSNSFVPKLSSKPKSGKTLSREALDEAGWIQRLLQTVLEIVENGCFR